MTEASDSKEGLDSLAALMQTAGLKPFTREIKKKGTIPSQNVVIDMLFMVSAGKPSLAFLRDTKITDGDTNISLNLPEGFDFQLWLCDSTWQHNDGIALCTHSFKM